MVAALWVVLLAIRGRVNATFTGRFAARSARLGEKRAWRPSEDGMLDKKEKVQIRSGQHLAVPAVTLAETIYKARGDIYENLDPKKEVPRSNVTYRGTIWRVTHPKGEVAVFATDVALLDMLKGDSKRFVDNMVKMFLDPKEWNKPTTTTSPGSGKVK